MVTRSGEEVTERIAAGTPERQRVPCRCRQHDCGRQRGKLFPIFRQKAAQEPVCRERKQQDRKEQEEAFFSAEQTEDGRGEGFHVFLLSQVALSFYYHKMTIHGRKTGVKGSSVVVKEERRS